MEKKEKSNFWQTERGKALKKLCFWAVFITILIVIVLVSEIDDTILDDLVDSPSASEVTENSEFISFSQMQETLLNNNYEYVYTITINEMKYIYSGMKSFGKEIGFREDADGIIKYYIDDTGTYQVNVDTVNLFNDLYLNIDVNYLNMDMLFTNLNEYLYSIEDYGNTRTIIYDKDGYQVTILTDLENITNINITTDTTIYELKFTKVGECATIDFTI